MVSELVLAENSILGSVVLLIFGYTSYRALQVRGSLAVGLYRRQALWIAAITALYTLLLLETYLFDLVFTTSNAYVDLVVSLTQDVGIITIFAWVDATAKIARRADPKLRDSLGWTRVRMFVWGLMAVSLGVTYYYSIGVVVSGGTLNSAPSTPLLISLSTFLLTPFVAGSMIIPVSGARSADPVFRTHLKWFGAFLVILVSTVIVAITTIVEGSTTGYIDITRKLLLDPTSTLAFFFILLLGGYAAYRSSRCLAPLNRISPE